METGGLAAWLTIGKSINSEIVEVHRQMGVVLACSLICQELHVQVRLPDMAPSLR